MVVVVVVVTVRTKHPQVACGVSGTTDQ